MASYKIGKKLTIARERNFIFIQINKLTTKIYSNLSHINIHYYLKLRIPIMHRQFFRKLSQNPDYIQTFCKDRRNLFHFACRKWYLYKNPQWCWSILTIMRIQLIGINIRIFVRVSEISVNIFENIFGKLLFSRPFY